MFYIVTLFVCGFVLTLLEIRVGSDLISYGSTTDGVIIWLILKIGALFLFSLGGYFVYEEVQKRSASIIF